MTPLVWANFPLALMFLLAWSGIPLWMVIKHPDPAPDFSEAHAYLAAKAARAGRTRSGTGCSLKPPEAHLLSLASARAWHQVPAADIGASAEPFRCSASAG